MKNLNSGFVLLLMLLILAPHGRAQSISAYPEARRSDHVDVYHGIEVADPYRWMEDMTSAETRAWVRAQDTLLHTFVRAVPNREALENRIAELWQIDAYAAPLKAGGRYFFTKTPGRIGNAILHVQDDLEAEPRVLLDVATHLDDTTLTLSGFRPSPDGRFVAYYTASGQSRWFEVRILDVESATDHAEVLTGLHALGGGVSWLADGSGFFYTRFTQPEAGTELQTRVEHPRLYLHRLGTPQSDDALIYERTDHSNWTFAHTTTLDGRYLVLIARDGTTGETQILYTPELPSVQHPPVLTDSSPVQGGLRGGQVLGNDGSRLFFYTNHEAPNGRIVALDVENPASEWTEIVPEGEHPIAGNSLVGGNAVSMLGGHLLVTYLQDARPRVRVFDMEGTFRYEVELPDIGAIWGGFSGRADDPEVFYAFLSLVEPGTVYRLDLESGTSTVFKRPELGFDAEAFETVQVFYESADGTRVPMFITHRRGWEPDGQSPVFMYGYGAYGWVAFPWYQPHIVAWLEQGGMYALPGIRGGGEYGEAWHRAGSGVHKQNAIDDYIAAAEWLITQNYTTPDRLVANGGSASGIVAAAALMQRPDLFGAGIIDIPALDMLRYHRFTGAGAWVQEFGSADDPEAFEALRSYSAYHAVEPETCYPPILTIVGERDETAVPMHGYKFTAALQAAQPCAHPVLLKEIPGAGHSHGQTPRQQARTWADALAFIARVM